ncbi:hypothetical protein J2S16_000545 [Cytobacillus kochii]|nr:hypothetical protein [Cytobacillus kochii]
MDDSRGKKDCSFIEREIVKRDLLVHLKEMQDIRAKLVLLDMYYELLIHKKV